MAERSGGGGAWEESTGDEEKPHLTLQSEGAGPDCEKTITGVPKFYPPDLLPLVGFLWKVGS